MSLLTKVQAAKCLIERKGFCVGDPRISCNVNCVCFNPMKRNCGAVTLYPDINLMDAKVIMATDYLQDVYDHPENYIEELL